jgi:hypothetical protein
MLLNHFICTGAIHFVFSYDPDAGLARVYEPREDYAHDS